jgi:hypothetical protein
MDFLVLDNVFLDKKNKKTEYKLSQSNTNLKLTNIANKTQIKEKKMKTLTF